MKVLSNHTSHNVNNLNRLLNLNTFFKRIPVCIAFFSVSGRLLQINNHFLNKLSIPYRERNSLSLDDFFEFSTLKLHEVKRQINSRKGYFSDEVGCQKVDGTLLWFKVSIFQDINLINDERILVLVANDITSTKMALAKSTETEAILNSIYENTYEGIYRKNGNKEIKYANRSFLTLFGYSNLNEMANVKFTQLYADPDKGTFIENQLQSKGYLRNEKVSFKRKDGTTFWGLMNANQSTSDNEIYFNGAVIDITEVVQKDEMLESKNIELTMAKEQLDRMLYSASHDLRSPITGLMGLINLFEMEFGTNDQIRHYCQMMKDCTNRLDDVINGINNYTLNTRKRRISERVYFTELISDVAAELRQLPNYDIVDLKVLDKSVCPFYSDKDRLHVVIKNILLNAYTFFNANVALPTIKVDVQTSAEQAKIIITDNGIGIANAHLDKVFGMFYKAHEGYSGTGLGLYIVKETLLKLGGTVSLKSSLNKGTKVEVVIPNDPKGKLMTRKIQFKNSQS